MKEILHERIFCFDNGCDPPKSKTPVPWVGAYVAVASLVCFIAMAADVFHGFRHKKLWFPCKFFTVNAASLMLLGTAMKLSVDLTTAMPGTLDQLTKLACTALMCTIIGNFMPSLGTLDDKEILMNIIALGILVITIVVNVCIQLSTGIIYFAILIEQTIVVFFMLVLFVILSFTALTVPTTKKYIEIKYAEIHKITLAEEETSESFKVEGLKRVVMKYWIMAATGSPQFVIARSVTCSASGAICLLTSLIFVEAVARLFFYFRISWGSDYLWSIYFIGVIQCGVVGVGAISLAFRWFTAIIIRCSKKGSNNYRNEFKIENYWTARLKVWKERPVSLRIRNRKCRKLFQVIKNGVLGICIGLQIMIVVVSKLLQFFCIFFMSPFLSFFNYCIELKSKIIYNSRSASDINQRETESEKLDINRYVLSLEGDVKLPDRILKNICDVVHHSMKKGNKKKPKHLIELLEKPTELKEVALFYSYQVPSLDSEPNCWSLIVVTLTSIAIALPNIEDKAIRQLLHGVSEGLLYINLVEETIDPKEDLINIGKAANVVWSGVELYRKWLNEDLRKMALEEITSMETLQKLAKVAKNTIERNTNENLKENHLIWPTKVIAAKSMYKVSQTLQLLLDTQGHKNQTHDKLFGQLCVMITNILSACLTNLPRVITTKCSCSAIERREESVLEAAHLLGEIEEILKILHEHCTLPSYLDLNQATHIDEWRDALIKQKNPWASISSSNSKEAYSEYGEVHMEAGSESGDFCIEEASLIQRMMKN